MEEKNQQLQSPKSFTGGMAFSAAVFAYVALSLIFSIIIAAAKANTSSQVVLYINYLIAPVAIGISLPLVLKNRKQPFKPLMPVKTHPKYYAIAVLLTFGLLFSLSWLNTGFEKLLRLCGYENELSSMPDLSGGMVVLGLIVIAVLPALFEETLFRGVILNCAEPQTGTLRSVLICGFCFSLFHASAVQTVYQFICGCSFALLAVRSRSVAPCMLAHFLNNAVIIVFEACGKNTALGLFGVLPLWAAILLTVLSALSFAAVAVWLILDKKPTYKVEAGGVKQFFISAAAGIIALAVIWIVNLF